MDDIAIKVEHVSKTFKLPHEKQSSVKGMLVNLLKGGKRSFEKQQVLKDVSFEIKKGEFFGIVGRNGSGKSTLLKLLAGIYSPNEGQVQVNGKLTPFIELGVGFNPELTGRENVFLNGALLGFNRHEITAMYESIVKFAELEKFMDQKLKNYSSGMQVRLAFSVAIQAKTDILLIDEVLAVGDQSFQEKCFQYFSAIKKSDTTVVFVTHDMSNVERFCDRVFIIDKKKEVNGLYTVPQAVRIYNQLNHELSDESRTIDMQRRKEDDIFIKDVMVLDSEGKSSRNFECGSPLTVKIGLAGKRLADEVPVVVGIAFHDKDGNNIAGPNSVQHHLTTASKIITYQLATIPFNMGEYYLTVGLFDEKMAKQYDLIDKGLSIFVNTKEVYYGKIVLNGEWK